MDCSWADKTIPSIGLIGIASPDNEWYERGLSVAHRSWILQNGSIALGWTPEFEGIVIVRATVSTIQATLIVRQPKCGQATDVRVLWREE